MPTPTPRIGIIGGSGMADALLASAPANAPQRLDLDTPFGKPSAPILLADYHAVPIAFLPRHGLGHTLPPSAVPFRANIYALKAAGCQWIIASGAVGSLREHIAPRDLVLVDQAIDKTTARSASFFDQPGAAVHVEFAEPFCPQLRAILQSAAATLPASSATIHPRGTYICMEGPAFSTRAESLMHRAWGGDLVGMTAMPEAKLAREAQISYALIALATDYDSWKPHSTENKPALLAEIIAHMNAASQNTLALLQAALPLLWSQRRQPFPAHHALERAIWTHPSKIPPDQKKRLELLWSPYV